MSDSRHCLILAPSPCAWTHHGYKHHAARGITAQDTLRRPSKYLPELTSEQIRGLEADTARQPTWRAGAVHEGTTRYLRDIARVIGWDDGLDATLSYVQCSGGATGGRTFHGRPMHRENPLAGKLTRGEA